MAEHDEHSSFIKTPQQLITVILLAFVVPIFGIIMTVQLVVNRPHADPSALTPEAIAARLKPVAGDAVVVEAGAAGAARTGDEIVKAVCGACHLTGAAGAPKIGDKAAWGPRIKEGFDKLLKTAIKGEKAMPPRGGASDLTDFELSRAIVFMTNQSGASFKEPPAPAAAKPAADAPKK